MQKLSIFPGIDDEVEVSKTVNERHETVYEPVVQEEIEIEHVIRNQPVDGPLPIRTEGDTVIVPLVKQVVRVEKEWILAEEVRVTRRGENYNAREDVTLQEEEAEIFDGEGWRVHEPRERGILGGRLRPRTG